MAFRCQSLPGLFSTDTGVALFAAARAGDSASPKHVALRGALVEIRNLQGQALELGPFDPGRTTVLHLKKEVAKRWDHAPVLCQRLLCGTTVLDDAAALANVGQKGDGDDAERPEAHRRGSDSFSPVLKLMLVISLDDVQRQFSDARRRVRKDAVGAFAQVAPPGNKGALAAILALLADPAADVRSSALHACARVARKGDERVLTAAKDRLKDSDATVRCAAAQTVALIAKEGCSDSIAQVSKLLSDVDPIVVKEALKALSTIAPAGGPEARSARVFAAVRAHLQHKRPEVRIAALTAFVNGGFSSAEGFREQVIEDVGRLLEDRDLSVRQEAVWALAHIVPDDIERAVVTAAARLKHGRAEVRLNALKALSREAVPGCDRALQALSDCMLDPTKGMRLEALKALSKLTTRGDPRIVDAVCACLRDHRVEVRLCAIRLLPHVAVANDPVALDAVRGMFADGHEALQREAVRAMRYLSQEADVRILEAHSVQDASDMAAGSPSALGKLEQHPLTSVAGRSPHGQLWNVWSERALVTPSHLGQFRDDLGVGAQRFAHRSTDALVHLGDGAGHAPANHGSWNVGCKDESSWRRGKVRNPLFAAAAMLMQE